MSSQAVTSFHIFPLAPANPLSPLVLASDNNLYGVSGSGGTHNCGTILKVTPAGAVSIVANFTGASGDLPGSGPRSSLIVGKDGNLYGVTVAGGSANSGVVFKYVPGGAATTMASFTGTSGALLGSDPSTSLVVLPNGDMYGTTSTGGASDDGTIFKVTSAGVVSSVASFTGISGALPGQTPAGLLTVGPDGNVYGVTSLGGDAGYNALNNTTGNNGTIFQVVPNGAVSCLVQFAGNAAPLGQEPMAGLTIGLDGNLYGTTQLGGSAGDGVVFQLTTGGQLTTVAQFGASLPGDNPAGALILAPDGNLYGTTPQGGTGDYPGGSIFKVVPGGAASSVYTFQQFGETIGQTPSGALVVGPDGNLYGTFVGNAQLAVSDYSGPESIFEFVPGSGVTVNGSIDHAINGALVTGSDGNLYGVCSQLPTSVNTGQTTSSEIFKVVPGGSVSSVAVLTNPEGINPNNFTKGPDGNLYGFVFNGTNQDLIQMTPAGAITARVTVTGSSTQEGGPFPSPLILGSDGNLWGTLSYIEDTSSGYINSVGDVINVVSTGTGNLSIVTVKQLPGQPGGMTLGNDGNIYGIVTSTAGSYVLQNGKYVFVQGPAAVYQITPAGAYTLEGTLDGTPGIDGTGGINNNVHLAVGNDGNLYGTTTNGGAYQKGSIYQVVPGSGISTVASFDDNATGLLSDAPNARLVAASDGNLYGTTQGIVPNDGGGGGVTVNDVKVSDTGSNEAVKADASPVVDNGIGTIFRYTPGGSATTIAAFTGFGGALPGQNPTGDLIVGSNGSLYGVASSTLYVGTGVGSIYKVGMNGTVESLGQLPVQAANFTPLLLAGDGSIYAASMNGGANNLGFIFRVGADDSLTIPFNFTGDSGAVPGSYPLSTTSLIYGDATHFYGLTYEGAGGTIYSVDVSQPFSQTILFPTVADQTYGGSLAIASASSLLPLTYVTTGPIQLSGNTATFTGVGPVSVTASQPGNALFTAAQSVTQTFNVNPAQLTYNARTMVRGFGHPNPVLSGTVSGFVNGDTQASATTGTLTFSSPATSASPDGYYDIAGSGLSATNYTFAQNPGNSYALNVVSSLTFSQWESDYGFYAYGNQTPLNDGVPFLLKYLFDINPSGPMSPADLGSLPSVGLDSTTHPGTTDLTLTYRQSALASGITINVQTSADLQTWTTVPTNQLDIDQVLRTDPTTGDLIMEVGIPLTGAAQYLRLNVTNP